MALTLRTTLLVLGAATALAASAAHAEDFAFQIQRVTLDGATYKPDGDGPFKDKFGAGGIAMKDSNNSILKGTMFGTYDPATKTYKPYPFGSDGYDKGVVFQNKTGKGAVTDIDIVMKNKTDTFKGSKGNADFTVTEGKNADGFATLTIKATNGKELKADEYLWIKIPPAPPNDGRAGFQFEAVLTPTPPPPAAPAPAPAPKAPATGGAPGAFLPSLQFDPLTGLLTFALGDITFAQYLDGSIATGNSATESIIGAGAAILSTHLIGPSATTSGAFEFDDTFLSIQGGGRIFLDATLGNLTLRPDASVSGYDSVLTGALVWDQSEAGAASRYLTEKARQSIEDALFFRSNLLRDTGLLTMSGLSYGTYAISSTASVPEPRTWLLLTAGLFGLGGLLRRARRRPLGA